MAKKAYPTAAILTVAVIFGLSFLFVKDILTYLLPFQLLGMRFALAALSLTMLVVSGVVKLNFKITNLPALIKIAIWQPVLYFICETYGIKYTSASEAGVIIALVPMVVTVLSIFMLGEKITLRQGISILAAVTGVMVMVLGGASVEETASSSHLIGVVLLVGAVMSGGFFNIYSRKAASQYSPVDITFVMMWLGAIVFNIIGLGQSYLSGQMANYYLSLQHQSVITSLIYLGVLSSVVGFFLLNYSLSYLPAARVAVFMNLIPVVTVVAALVFYGEVLTAWQLLGGVFILLGVWGTNRFAPRAKKQPNPVLG